MKQSKKQFPQDGDQPLTPQQLRQIKGGGNAADTSDSSQDIGIVDVITP